MNLFKTHDDKKNMKRPKAIIVIPAYNESANLEKNIGMVYEALSAKKLDFDWTVVIAENGSKDNTFDVANKLAKKYKNVQAVHLNKASKDNAIIETWMGNEADVFAFTDADNSAHPKYLPILINEVLGGYDLAIGCRFAEIKNSRGFYRDFISSIYNRIIIPIVLPTGVRDAQCGIKAVSRDVARTVAPKMMRENGFFDSELLAVSKHKKYKVKEIAVSWHETRKSVLSVNKNIPNFLKNIFRTRMRIRKGYYD